MSPAAAVLATIPPAFAILIERFNPVSARAIRTSVEKDLELFQSGAPAAHQSLVDHSAKMVEGGVEVAGLASTFVACLTSGFGVLSEYPNPWLIVAYILVFLAILLFLLHYLAGRSFLEMVTQMNPVPLPWVSARPPVEIVSRIIYFANFLLIAFVAIVLLVSQHGHLFGLSAIEAD